jgi:hypothetical protein
MSPNIKLPKQLLVEGKTAELFFQEAIRAMALNDQIEVQNFKGIDELSGYLKVFQGLKEFREKVISVGIIRDAEDSVNAAFNSVQHSLAAAGLPKPTSMNTFIEGPPRTAIFILPDCKATGMLETLC